MRIASVKIENLRSFKEETIHFDNYTCLVGPNGAGKSTVLCALNIFFRENNDAQTNLFELDVEDFHGRDPTKPIVITVTFTDLPEQAQKEFKDYFRLGQLVISARAEFDPQTNTAKVCQYGQRRGMEEFRAFFEAEKTKASVDDLKNIYGQLKERFTDLPLASTKAKMVETLNDYEEKHPDLCALIPSKDEFYGFTKGANKLTKWVQWVFIPAVKDASAEQSEGKDTALGRLLQRTVRAGVSFEEQINGLRREAQEKYEEVLSVQQDKLTKLSEKLKKRIAEWAHPDASLDLKWHQDINKSVRIEEPLAEIVACEGTFNGKLSRFGHGFQRSYLLALLQELANVDDSGWPKLILGCEEPELYQHPPQCRHLAKVLQELSNDNSQVIVCTHSPFFVSGKAFEQVRVVRKDETRSRSLVIQLTASDLVAKLAQAREDDPPEILDGHLAKIHQALQPTINEIFFTNRLVLVEGREDVAYLTTYMTLLEIESTARKMGFHIVPTDSKSRMVIPLAIAAHMKVPTFVMFDSDGHRLDKNGSKTQHRKDNNALLYLAGTTGVEPFSNENTWLPNLVMWRSEIADVVKGEIQKEKWTQYANEVAIRYGHEPGLEKNPLFIADVLERAWGQGDKSESLIRVCEAIIDFGKSVT